MHPPGPSFYARSKKAAHWGRFGALGTNTLQRWRGEGMVVLMPFLIHFARLVAIIGRSNSKKCIIYLLKTVLEVLVVMVFSAF